MPCTFASVKPVDLLYIPPAEVVLVSNGACKLINGFSYFKMLENGIIGKVERDGA